MLATAGDLPSAADEEAWAFEMKWDGVRAVVYVDGDVRVLTRNDREVAATYPELRGLADVLSGRPLVLDGEIVALDEAGRPSFGQLQARMHVQRPSSALLAQVPVSLLVFDVLHAGGEPQLSRTYDQRRAVLEDFGLPGRRSRDWVKVKHILMQEVVVGGWSPGEGRRAGGLGSLLLGVPDDDGRLVYAGHVGTGFSDRVLADLMTRLTRLEQPTPPFADEVPRAHARGARWVQPLMVGEVAFSEWTRDGRMRHPTWRGLRSDKEPGEVRRES